MYMWKPDGTLYKNGKIYMSYKAVELFQSTHYAEQGYQKHTNSQSLPTSRPAC